jgi:Ca2+-binding RTX toxin-like protein
LIRKLTVAAAAVAFVLVVPASASAAVSCTFAAGTVNVTVTNGTIQPMVTRGEAPNNNDIVISSSASLATPVACAGGTPTIATTNQINLDENGSNQGTQFFLDLRRGGLGPGLTNEGDGSSEIELNLEADATGHDRLVVQDLTGAAARNYRFGALAGGDLGANLNGGEAAADLDLTATGIDGIFSETTTESDTLTADGSTVPTATGPLTIDVALTGGLGGDTIVGGDGTNSIDGGDGDDTLTGGPNSDTIKLGTGSDVADGGDSAADYATYLNDNVPVSVDLREQPAPQDTGPGGTDTLMNFESLIGSNASDVLIGDDANNSLVGGQLGGDTGDDELRGNGGPDFLSGGPGDDSLFPGAGDDAVIGAEGVDTLNYDELGTTGAVEITLDAASTDLTQNTGGSGTDTLTDSVTNVAVDHEIENLVGSDFAGDVLTGSAANNVIRAYDGFADTVSCLAGAGDLAILDDVDLDVPDPACETSDNAPRTSIAGGPADGASTDDTTPTYDLDADKPATFELSVDGGAFVPCADPCTTPVLALGAHTVAFRATDTDGNDNPELTPVQRALTVVAPTVPPDNTPPKDTTAPETTAKGPKAKTTKAKAKVTFSSSEPNSTFECKLDKAAYKPCASPFRKKVKVGKHTLLVRATNAAGNTDPTPAKVRWRRVED